jgi:hypothetical protein
LLETEDRLTYLESGVTGGELNGSQVGEVDLGSNVDEVSTRRYHLYKGGCQKLRRTKSSEAKKLLIEGVPMEYGMQ